MAARIVQLGSPRTRGEGIRLGTVRRPPRGVPKSEHARGNWYDVWLPDLAPSAGLLKLAQQRIHDDEGWAWFERRYRAEMKAPDHARLLDLLAAMSRHADFSVGCYCPDERRCHRSILRQLLLEHGATIAG